MEASMQPEESHAAPNLILLSSVASLEASDGQVHDGKLNILGLGLVRRMVLAARRAGCGQIFFLGPDCCAQPGTTAIPDWGRLADVLLSHAASLVIAPATILAETDWLERLAATQIEPAAWAAITHRIVVLAATAVPDALAVLHEEGGAHGLAAVEDRLIRRFGSAAAIPSEIDPMVVATSKDIPVAERRLLRALVKKTDGFMARHVDRAVSLQISRRLAPTAVTPTQITMVSVVIGLCGAPFFLSSVWSWQTVGALLFLAHSIVDGCDGELARLKFQESRYGGILDFWGDNIVHVGVFACMAVGWTLSSAAAWPLLLGAAATAGTLGSAGFVYWRQLRGRDGSGPLFTSVSTVPDDRLARLLDAASRRDFIYLVLVLALLGKSSWFLVLAALGAPIFFFLLIFLAVREQLRSSPTTSGA
jgi:1L-myo-inositol 1-phosphate cytidylyltransferase / CDP-L-myo-inositol myo-inositolphosphotransferase